MATPQERRLWPVGYFLAALSFIPLLGIPFALTAMVRGLLTHRRGSKFVALAGALGLIGSLAFYFWSLDRFINKRDEQASLNRQQALNLAVNAIENYKSTHNEYPNVLSDVYDENISSSDTRTKMGAVLLTDPKTGRLFFYKKLDPGHYYLRGLAPDGKPFSEGALTPQVEGEAGGLVTTAPTGSTSP